MGNFTVRSIAILITISSVLVTLLLVYHPDLAIYSTPNYMWWPSPQLPQKGSYGQVFKKFTAHSDLAGISVPTYSKESRKHTTWDELLLTPEGGFLDVEKNDGTIQQYGVSMFHQLHCLLIIRDMLVNGKTSVHNGVDSSNPHSKRESTHAQGVHWSHCLHYIAQASIDDK